MPIGIVDLSAVTHLLIKRLEACRDKKEVWASDPTAEFSIDVTGLAPDAARKETTCQLSLYLFHVAADEHNLNTYPGGGPPRTIPEQPLSLTLSYLLTASGPTHVQEQQAMSIGLKCFHEHPFLQVDDGTGVNQRLTVTLERQGSDEVGRLWQATSTPFRLSAVYRVSVVFLKPRDDSWKPAKPVLHDPVVAAVPNLHAQDLPKPIYLEMREDRLVFIRGEGFKADEVQIFFRGLEIEKTPANPPAPGQFRFVSGKKLLMRIPEDARPGSSYPMTVRAAEGEPTYELMLEVPWSPYYLEMKKDRLVIIHGKGFKADEVEISCRGLDVRKTTANPPGPGRFRFVSSKKLEMGIPHDALSGSSYRMTVRAAEGEPTYELMLEVPRNPYYLEMKKDRLVAIHGRGFKSDEVEIFFDDTEIQLTAATPPAPGRFRFVSSRELEMGIPDDAVSGSSYPLTVRASDDERTYELTLEMQ